MDPALRKRHWRMLAAYLAGEINDRNNAEVDRWLGNPVHARFFKTLQADWLRTGKMQQEGLQEYNNPDGIRQPGAVPHINQSNQPKMKNQFDVDRAWNRLYERIQENNVLPDDQAVMADTTGFQRLFLQYPVVVRLAASVLIVAAAALAVYFSGILPDTGQKSLAVTTGTYEGIKEIVLHDGSTVYLNSGTRLVYPRSFGSESRQVELSGEAFFEVMPDKDRPFLVSAEGALIRVVGTSFSVNARKNAHKVEVFVETGIVRLTAEADNTASVMLGAGYAGTYSEAEGLNSSPGANRNSIAWKTREMAFNHTPLSEALQTIGNVYKVNIVLENPVTGQVFITGEFNSDPLDEVLEVICIQNHLGVEKSGNIIYLSPV